MNTAVEILTKALEHRKDELGKARARRDQARIEFDNHSMVVAKYEREVADLMLALEGLNGHVERNT